MLIVLAVVLPKIHSQPSSQEDIFAGKSFTLTIQATGTQPLSYQWQWKPFGKKDDNSGWQNLSGEDSMFQVMKVQSGNAGYYRCVVSNYAGSEVSQFASLTVGKYANCSLLVCTVRSHLSNHFGSEMGLFGCRAAPLYACQYLNVIKQVLTGYACN